MPKQITWTEFNKRLSEVFKEFGGIWAVEEDGEGQVLIYTGLRELADGETLVEHEPVEK